MREDSVALVLEGSNERAALMYQRFPVKISNRVIWVKTAEEAIDVLENYKKRLFLVSLSYDLDERRHTDPRSEECGMEVVRWLEKHNSAEYMDCSFVVHSWNQQFGPKMFYRLRKAGYNVTYKPFGS